MSDDLPDWAVMSGEMLNVLADSSEYKKGVLYQVGKDGSVKELPWEGDKA